MRYLFAGAILLSLFGGCAHMSQDTGLNTYAQGILYEGEGKTDEAIASYGETIRKSGEDGYLYVKLGNLYLKKQDSVQARRCFARAMKLDPQRAEAFFGMGVACLLGKDSGLAALYMEKGLEIDKENHSARMILCDLYTGMNRLEEAAVHYKYLLDVFPENYIFRYNYGNILERMGREKEAEESYLKTIELADFFWKAHFSLGLLYSKLGEEDGAIEYLSRALQLNPADGISYSLLASIYYQRGDTEKARDYINRALDQGIKTAEFYNFLGLIYSDEKNYEKAEESFRESLKIQDTSPVRFYLGAMYDKWERRDKMEVEMKKAIELKPDNALALNYLGYTYLLEDRNIREAYRMIKRACEIEPDNGAFIDSLGWAYYKMGDYVSAGKHLEKAASLEKDAEIYEHLGYLYLATKEYYKALLWFTRAYEMGGKKDLLKIIDEVRQRINNGAN